MNIKAYRIEVSYCNNCATDASLVVQPFKKNGKEIIFLDIKDAIDAAETKFQDISGLDFYDDTWAVCTGRKTVHGLEIYWINNEPGFIRDCEHHQASSFWQCKVIEREVWASEKKEG